MIFGHFAALRSSENCSISMEHFHYDTARSCYVFKSTGEGISDGKTGSRTSTIPKELACPGISNQPPWSIRGAMNSYLELRKTCTQDRLWLKWDNKSKKYHNKPLGKNYFYNMYKAIAEFNGLRNPSKYTGHAGRRTTLTTAANNGANTEQLMRIAGHKSASTSRTYIEDSVNGKVGLSQMLMNDGIQNTSNEQERNVTPTSPPSTPKKDPRCTRSLHNHQFPSSKPDERTKCPRPLPQTNTGTIKGSKFLIFIYFC